MSTSHEKIQSISNRNFPILNKNFQTLNMKVLWLGHESEKMREKRNENKRSEAREKE
jgi:hypothetical protein